MINPTPPKISKCPKCGHPKVRYLGIQRGMKGEPLHHTFDCSREPGKPPYCGTGFSVPLK